jgi:hypothetical protein
MDLLNLLPSGVLKITSWTLQDPPAFQWQEVMGILTPELGPQGAPILGDASGGCIRFEMRDMMENDGKRSTNDRE